MIFSTSDYYLLRTSSDLRAPPRVSVKLWEADGGHLVQAIIQQDGIRYEALEFDFPQSFTVRTSEMPKKGLYVVAKGEDAFLQVLEVYVYEDLVQIVERQ